MHSFLFRLLLTSLALTLLLMNTALTQAVTGNIDVLDPDVEYTFGESITFKATLRSDDPVKEVQVFLRPQGENRTIVGTAELRQDGELVFVYDPSPQRLRAFSRIEYWFDIIQDNGSITTSPTFSFLYEDNRYEWRSLSRQPFHVHWYDGDVEFAQNVLDVAHEGLKKAQRLLMLKQPEEVHIYVYASGAELSSTLRLAKRDGIAGHADVDLALIMVALPDVPDRGLETERRIPHELMHILLYQATGLGYENIPTWLDEGLASIVELYPSPEYQVILESALERDGLLPINSLCRRFPVESPDFDLSYAESAYFTRFLYRSYGSASLEALVSHYADGLECDKGIELVYEQSLGSLEQEWLKEDFGFHPAASSELSGELWPWFLLLGLVVGMPFMVAIPALAKNRAGRETGIEEIRGE